MTNMEAALHAACAMLLLAASTGCERGKPDLPAPSARAAISRGPGQAAPASFPTAASVATQNEYRWLQADVSDTLERRVAPPQGYSRIPLASESFGRWLRGLPLRPGRSQVHLYSGALKANQSAHYAVIDIDAGNRDLQQCADAVIRLRAEFLFARGRDGDIQFHFTSGDLAQWTRWREGCRPRVQGNSVQWRKSAQPDSSYASFRAYLDTVFTYAGTMSLSRELASVADPAAIDPGDVFIRAGNPGHAAIVLDVAANAAGDRVFLLAQGYMPAQDVHVLVNPGDDSLSPWYQAKTEGELRTPEYLFQYEDLRR